MSLRVARCDNILQYAIFKIRAAEQPPQGFVGLALLVAVVARRGRLL